MDQGIGRKEKEAGWVSEEGCEHNGIGEYGWNQQTV